MDLKSERYDTDATPNDNRPKIQLTYGLQATYNCGSMIFDQLN